MDEARAGAVTFDEGVEQPVDMAEGLAAALRRKPRRLIEHDRVRRLLDHHRACLRLLILGQLAAAGRSLGARRIARRNAQDLACCEPVVGLCPRAVDPDLPGPRPARDGGEADFGQMTLEPAVQPHTLVILGHGVLPDLSLFGALFIFRH